MATNVINAVLAQVLDIGIAEAEQYEPQVLAILAQENVSIEKAVDLFVNSLKVGGALGLILPAFKGALVTQLNALIDTQAVTQEKALYNLILAAAQTEAKRLAA